LCKSCISSRNKLLTKSKQQEKEERRLKRLEQRNIAAENKIALGEKRCSKCGEIKPLEQFYSTKKRVLDGRQSECKECVTRSRNPNYDKYLESKAERDKLYASGLKQCCTCKQVKPVEDFYKCLSRFAQSQCKACSLTRNQSPEAKQYFVQYSSLHRQKNKSLYAYWSMKRHTQKLRATVGWASSDKIKFIYAECANMTETTGVKHEVDHIVPLQSPLVCGLHCSDKLQILTKSENLKK